MTNEPDEPPWGNVEYTPEEQARYARYEAAASDRYYNVPARSPEMRAEYDRQEEDERQIEAGHERYIHFYGTHSADPYIEHGDCVDFCPYDTPDQAQERAERRAYADAREAEYEAEMEGRNITGHEDRLGEWAEADPADVAEYDDLQAALRTEEAARQNVFAGSDARREALIAQREGPWPSEAHDEASARAADANAARLAAIEAYHAARLGGHQHGRGRPGPRP